MNINEKIEEIRKKPEHIRMRYVIGCVAAFTFVLFVFWIFSVKNSLQKTFSKSGDSSETCSEESGTCSAPDIFKGFLQQNSPASPEQVPALPTTEQQK